jgi:hypothetical protein
MGKGTEKVYTHDQGGRSITVPPFCVADNEGITQKFLSSNLSFFSSKNNPNKALT